MVALPRLPPDNSHTTAARAGRSGVSILNSILRELNGLTGNGMRFSSGFFGNALQ